MKRVTLDNWVANRWLERLDSDADEVRRLLRTADAYLADYQKAVEAGQSADAQLDFAYGAARACATAALRAAGYRVVRGGSEHYRTFQALEFSIDPEKKITPTLDKLRKKRNIGAYDDRGLVSQVEADHCGKVALLMRKQVEDWIRATHPEKLAK